MKVFLLLKIEVSSAKLREDVEEGRLEVMLYTVHEASSRPESALPGRRYRFQIRRRKAEIIRKEWKIKVMKVVYLLLTKR